VKNQCAVSFCATSTFVNHFVRELVEAAFVKRIPLRTHKMMADALIKSLSLHGFIGHRRVMMGQTPFALMFLHS